MEQMSPAIVILFILSAVFCVLQFYQAAGRSGKVAAVLLVWMVVLAAGGLSGFFQVNDTLPPRFIFMIGPGLLMILLLFLTRRGKAFIDELRLKPLILLHVVRIPVEITLYALFMSGLVPELMTFEGYNFDILSGISAIAVYAALSNGSMGRKLLLAWNVVGLLLLANIVVIAILSAPTPFQQLAFDQPNTAVTYFPYVWLPGVIVPLVLVSHLAAIRQLWQGKSIKIFN